MRDIIPQMEPWFDEAEATAVFDYMKGGGWVMGFKETEKLEKLICEFTGAKYCILTVNGTVALTLSLLGLGLKSGDEVLVPDLTMIASPNSAVLIGIKPVLVDVREDSLCMDLEKAKDAITPKTKALMYVPFNGRSDNMNEVLNFCKVNDLLLIEDAAQAFGSFFNGKHLGTFGDVGAFSFSVPKIITTGQGGAVVTNNDKLFKKLRQLKDFGRENGGSDIHNEWGWNFKFTDIQAVIGIEQMKKLPERVDRKKAIYKRYADGLGKIDGVEMLQTDLRITSPWFIDIFVDDPKSLSDHLKENNIGSRTIYPAIHTQTIYSDSYAGIEFPVSVKYAKRGLWLPSSARLTDEEINYVTGEIRRYYQL